jgi:hypothetical protein
VKSAIASAGHVVVVDSFFDGAKRMRKEFDARLSDARDPFDPRRFAWEPWHIEHQFSQARTPAATFFDARTYEAFERRLLSWAGLTLGLSALGAPAWLSSLVDGDFQALHRDSPNGDFAFSFGLSRGSFTGGDTLVANFDLLDYFRRGAHTNERADAPLFDEIAPRMNRLVAFDARLPHAVRAVCGPRHVRDGRVAIQGWLVPSGAVVRAGERDAIERVARAACARVRVPKQSVAGLLSVRVGKGGGRAVCDTLVDTGARAVRDEIAAAFVRALAHAPFPKDADAVIPILIDAKEARAASKGPTGWT